MEGRPKARIESIDLLRGVVILLMALDHVRMYFGQGTWWAEPTNLHTTTPLLFLTRWITHFCAPVVTAEEFMGGSLADSGFNLVVVYLVWALVMLGMLPLCKLYRAYKKGHPEQRLLAYL